MGNKAVLGISKNQANCIYNKQIARGNVDSPDEEKWNIKEWNDFKLKALLAATIYEQQSVCDEEGNDDDDIENMYVDMLRSKEWHKQVKYSTTMLQHQDNNAASDIVHGCRCAQTGARNLKKVAQKSNTYLMINDKCIKLFQGQNISKIRQCRVSFQDPKFLPRIDSITTDPNSPTMETIRALCKTTGQVSLNQLSNCIVWKNCRVINTAIELIYL